MNHMVGKDNFKLLPVENSFGMCSQRCFTDLKHEKANELRSTGCSTNLRRYEAPQSTQYCFYLQQLLQGVLIKKTKKNTGLVNTMHQLRSLKSSFSN